MGKFTNKLSKKARLNKIKQKLCNKINECKSLEELKGWERTFSYHPVLKDDQDWDEGFFFDLIEFKLKRMREYFWTHHIVENEKQYGDICNRLINILNAGYKTDIVLDIDLKSKVNDRNRERFLNEYEINFISKCPQYYYAIIREAKAKALFWKYLHHKVECLWD